MIKAGIFVEELTVAVITGERVTSLHPLRHIKPLDDNTAAMSVLRRLAFSTSIGND